MPSIHSQDSVKPRRRRWARFLLPLGALAIVTLLSVPQALNTGSGRAWLLSKANRALAPGRLELDSLRFSWFGSTRMTAFTLVDAQGDHVVVAPSAVWDRNLWQALFGQPKLGTLRLEHAEIDAERLPDGKIDLYETLRPILGRDPKTALRIEVADGRLRFRGTGLGKPVVSDHTEVMIAIDPTPRPLQWSFRLAKGSAKAPESVLEGEGRFDQWAAKAGRPGDLDFRSIAQSWPFVVGDETGGSRMSGAMDGRLSLNRTSGKWSLACDGGLAGLELDAKALCALPLPVDGLHGHLDVRTEGATTLVAGSAETDDPKDSERHVNLSVQASLAIEDARIDLTQLVLDTHFARLELSGEGSLKSDIPRRLDLQGALSPRSDAINTWLGAHLEAGARLSAAPSAVQVRATLGPNGLEPLDGRFGLAINEGDVYGMKLGKTEIVARLRNGKASIDPVDATLNGGVVHLEPKLQTTDNADGPFAIVLGPESYLKDAEINETVSRRVLSYVAPVLDNATRVRGRVSAELDEARFPLGRESAKDMTLEGNVVFQDVEFLPSPLFQDLLALVGREDRALLRLNDPAAFSIADQRVYQKGLRIPIGNQGDVEIQGWVDFDKNLNLSARIPILPNALAKNPLLAGIASGERLTLPIRGTLKNPEIDKTAFKEATKDLERSLVERAVGTGLSNLIRRMAEGPTGDGLRMSQPRLTPEERKMRRLEKREERQKKRTMPP